MSARVLTALLFVAMGFFLFSGCKKNSAEHQDDDYFIRFKVDGTQKEYRTPNYNRVNYVNDGTSNVATINGVANLNEAQTVPPKNMISIIVRSNEPFSTKTYMMQQALQYNGFDHPAIIVTYTTETGEAFSASLLKSQHPALDITNDASVSFTNINNSSSRGTFNAILTTPDRSRALVITDGEFHLPGGR